MAYDTSRRVTVLFGGSYVDGGETWQWDAGTWERIAGNTPFTRYGHAMAYDTARGVTVLFGGQVHDEYSGTYRDGGTWEYGVVQRPCSRDPAWVCDGDVDGNGTVNPIDVGLVQAAFCAPEDCSDDDLCQYDIDCNGAINPVDSGIVQLLFGACEEPRDVCP
jgi:hypothetical protein